MVSPALPLMREQLGVSRAEIAWAVSGVLLSGAVATPVIGRLADIWDKRKVLLGVLAVVCIGTVISALSVSVLMLTLGQVLQGVGLGTVPLAVGIMRQTQSERRVKSGNGIMVGTIFFCTAVAMVASGVVADHLHYGWLFWFPFMILVVGLIVTWHVVPSCPPPGSGRSRRVDLPGAALLGGGLAMLLYGITMAATWGWISTGFLSLVGVSCLLVALFIVVELRTTEPLVDIRILTSRSVITASCFMVVSGFSMNVLFVAIPMQVQEPISTGYGLGATGTITGFILLPGILIGTAAPVASWLDRTIGQRATAVFGPMCSATGFLIMLGSAGSLPMVLIALVVGGFGTAATITQAMNIVVSSVPSERVGAFSGLAFVIKAVGGTLGAQLTASILATDSDGANAVPSWGAFKTIFFVGAAVCLTVTLCGLRLLKRGSGQPAQGEGAEPGSGELTGRTSSA
ncbi:MFS transporter [Streptomyces viridiviolaceus]|uniref:MFS transporter n=1 Tax=Streptomyces viridiviolaceus TaxID=68282 RepID=A0ABW2ED25_9ACTN|nr:MFS transporter [Streptomyces viridiviolaceus]GHB67579.1 MFS transporter [Streptomyces viridiviolaceus]